jgi:hypothetical protein
VPVTQGQVHSAGADFTHDGVLVLLSSGGRSGLGREAGQ